MAVLPQFTLLHGPTKTCHLFASELINRCNCDILDLEFPLTAAMTELFYNTISETIDLNSFEDRLNYLPFSGKVTIATWLTMQRQQIREDLGPDILGRILQATYANFYADSGVPCIVRDLDKSDDVTPILAYADKDSVWVINLGPLTDTFQVPVGTQVCWIAALEPKAQVDQYLHDLEVWNRKGAA